MEGHLFYPILFYECKDLPSKCNSIAFIRKRFALTLSAKILRLFAKVFTLFGENYPITRESFAYLREFYFFLPTNMSVIVFRKKNENCCLKYF